MRSPPALIGVGKSPYAPYAYWIACACLIALAAGLRLYGLSDNSLWRDEAIVANLSRGTFSELYDVLRARHSAPLLHPLVLWLVQKVESSAFSVRLVPATASMLVVAGMLLLLPRFVGRWTSFQAALLYTFATEAIRAARDAREYAIDALVAVLIIVGLLSLLRGGTAGRRGCVLLCVALFAAPLVQYGLVLLCCATLAAVVLARFIRLDGPRSGLASPWNGTSRFRVGNLVWLFGSFAAGCCISYATTLRYQWRPAYGAHLAHGYYGGAYADPLEALAFVARGGWDIVASNLPLPWAILFTIVFGVALLNLRTRFDAIIVTASLAFGLASLAGLLRVYPLVGTRHAMYLIPVLLLAATHATHLAISRVSKATGRPWIVHAAMGLLAAITVASGTVAVANGKPYKEKQGMKSVLAVLEGRVQENDAVFVAKGAEPAARFYLGTPPPSNYYFSKRQWGCPVLWHRAQNDRCVGRNLVVTEGFLQYLVQTGLEPSNRLYIVSSWIALPDFRLLMLFYQGVEVERLVEARGNTNLHVLEAPELMDRLAAPASYRGLRGKPVIESTFDVYLTDQMLLFVKEQCHLDDIDAPFFVHAFPENVDDLPVDRRARGFDERSFHFIQSGVMMDHICAALVPLPSLPIDRIRVGQGTQNPIWSGEAAIDRTDRSSSGLLYPDVPPAASA